MLRKIVLYGVIAGVIVGVPLFGLTVAWPGHLETPWAAVAGYLTMLIALSTVFVAIKRRRDVDLGGVIKFWPAFGMGLAISTVAGIFYVIAWEAAVGVTHMDFAGAYAQAQIEHQKANGVTGEALSRYAADMERWKAAYANPLYRLPMTFAEILPVGVLVSLVSAGLLRNSRFLPARRN
jgi:hypothetical protein